jgi:hypothetical protein
MARQGEQAARKTAEARKLFGQLIASKILFEVQRFSQSRRAAILGSEAAF